MTVDETADKAKPKPPKVYKIVVDKTQYETVDPSPTGLDLLVLAGKVPPERFQIFERLPGGDLREIAAGQHVDLTEPGKERFVTLPLDQSEGEADETPPRRDFRLSEADSTALDALGLRWETLREGETIMVLIRDYPIPPGYNVLTADIHLRLGPSYPETQIDMVYVRPALARADGVPVGALTLSDFAGCAWQQWSRHRTGTNPWRPGVDDIATHLALVNHWFAREFLPALAA